MGDTGHLNNEYSAHLMCDVIGENTKEIVLAHLSQDNNTEELAYETLENRLKEDNKHVDNIIITKQNEETELINV